jgi:DNA uptake protein ComE-like DNA-binding protein
MYQKFKQYFEISRREFRGMIVFVIILLLIYIAPYVYEKLTFESVKIEIETLLPKIVEIERFKQDKVYADDNRDNLITQKPILFHFNPNNLPVDDWMKMGLSEKQAKSIKKYESKGGKFKSKADVKKMYAITNQMYQNIEMYIQIPDEVKAAPSFAKSESLRTDVKPINRSITVDINAADSLEFLNVRGIGPAFASRIINYRNRLGGFHSKTQLKEVWGLDSLKYSTLENQIVVNNISLRKINLNNCSFEDIKMFPYLSYKQMNAIIAYRKQHGNYKSVEDLNKIAILTPQIIQKINPYLNF